MLRTISAPACAAILALLMSTDAMAARARPSLPERRPAELRIEILMKAARYGEAVTLAERHLADVQARGGAGHPEEAKALTSLAEVLEAAGRYPEAEEKARAALAIRETAGSPEGSALARTLGILGLVLGDRGRHKEAVPILERALSINERARGPNDRTTSDILMSMATVKRDMGQLAEAEPFARRAFAIREKALGAHPDTAWGVGLVAAIVYDQGRRPESEPLFERARAMRAVTLPPDHPDVALSLGWTGLFLRLDGKPAEAEAPLQRALDICVATFGTHHYRTGGALLSLARLRDQQGRLPEAETLYKQALAAFEVAYAEKPASIGHVLLDLGRLTVKVGRLKEAQDVADRALAIFEKAFGAEHAHVLAALKLRGQTLQAQGDYQEALPVFERAVALTQKLRGEKHLDVIQSLAPLILMYYGRGFYDEAEASTRLAIDIVSALPPADRDSLIGTYYLSLGFIAQARERYAQAEVHFLEALKLTEKLTGDRSPQTADRLGTLGTIYTQQARFRDAETAFRRQLAILEGIHGAEHPVIGKVLERFGFLQMERARYGDAKALFERALAIQEKAGDMKEVADLQGNMGTLLEKLGRYDEAEQAFRRAIAMEEQVEPAASLRSPPINNLANLLGNRGRFAEAEALLKHLLEIGPKIYEPDHPTMATWYNNLGTLYASWGRMAEAADMNRRALEIEEKRAVSKTAPVNNRANLYMHDGRLVEAEALYRQVLAETEQRYDPSHPDVALGLNNLATALEEQGKYAEAAPLLLRALSIRETVFGASHPEVADSQEALASLRHAQGDVAEAEQRYRAAIAINESVLGLEHPSVALSYSNIGFFLTETGRPAEGEAFLRRAVDISTKVLGVEHPSTLIKLGNLASAVSAQKRFAEAEKLQKQNLELRAKVYGADHPATALARNNLASLYHDQERYEEAVSLAEQALAAAESRLGRMHPQVVTMTSNLGLGLFRLGRYAEAEPLLDRALASRRAVFGDKHPLLADDINAVATLKEKATGDLPAAYDLIRQASSILVERARRQSGVIDAIETGRGRAELRSNANVFVRHAQIGWRLAQALPERAAAVLDEAFQMTQWGHQSAAAAALSQMTARLSQEPGERATLIRRRQDLVWQYHALDAQLLAASARPAEARNAEAEAGWRRELARLDAEIRTLDLTLKQRYPDYAALANPEPLSVAEVQGQLRAGEALFQISIGRERSVAWVITPEAAEWRELAVTEASLDTDVEALRCGLDKDTWQRETAKNLERRARCRTFAGERAALFDLERAHKLYQALFAPFEALIRDRQLLFVPSGALTTLPIHVLVTEAPAETGDPASPDHLFAQAAWLGKRQPITVLPSIASLKAARTNARTSAAPNPFIGIANPLLRGEFGKDERAWARQSCQAAAPDETASIQERGATASPRGIADLLMPGSGVDLATLRNQPPLPDTANEVCAVARDLGAAETDVYLGAKATEATVKGLSDAGKLRSYRILHFATHGLIAGETESVATSKAEPSLMLTPPEFATAEDDGLLMASEVARLSLDADAVILSACNTASASGAPEAEALSGLARAFFYAGARALFVTHWYVDDDAAVELVTGTFAERKREASLPLAEALRRAMVKAIDAGGNKANPSYWAPFVLVAAN